MHYSGKVVPNSRVHLGVFLRGRCGGVLSFGPSMDKKALIGLVTGTQWNEFIELNRMVLADWLPRNSESRAISVAMRMLRKQYAYLKWVVSFADAGRCGDGTIYRASGFVLTGIRKLAGFVLLPNGQSVHKMTVTAHPNIPRPELGGRSLLDVTGGSCSFRAYVKATGGTVIPGYSLRYIYFLKPEERANLAVPVLPFSKIDELGARMVRGIRQSSVGSPAV